MNRRRQNINKLNAIIHQSHLSERLKHTSIHLPRYPANIVHPAMGQAKNASQQRRPPANATNTAVPIQTPYVQQDLFLSLTTRAKRGLGLIWMTHVTQSNILAL